MGRLPTRLHLQPRRLRTPMRRGECEVLSTRSPAPPGMVRELRESVPRELPHAKGRHDRNARRGREAAELVSREIAPEVGLRCPHGGKRNRRRQGVRKGKLRYDPARLPAPGPGRSRSGAFGPAPPAGSGYLPDDRVPIERAGGRLGLDRRLLQQTLRSRNARAGRRRRGEEKDGLDRKRRGSMLAKLARLIPVLGALAALPAAAAADHTYIGAEK